MHMNNTHCLHRSLNLVHSVEISPERQSARMSKITIDGLNTIWHRMLYSCTHMATVGVKGLTF